jgi:general secretion pathway protein L
MLEELLRWWARHLRLLLPRRAASPRRLLLLDAGEPDAPGLTLTLRRRQAETPLGRFALDPSGGAALRQALRAAGRAPAVLRLPPGRLLEREIMLPLAAEAELAGALWHEMDRVTPFRPADVFWSWEVIGRDRRRGLLRLRLLLVPRATVAAALAAAVAAGVAVTQVQGPGANGALRRITLAATEWRPWQRFTLRTAALACAVLMVAMVAAPFLRQESLLEEVDARIALLQPRAREAVAAQRRAAEVAASGDVITATEVEFGNALGILATVTGILPDHTWLTGFALKQRQLTLRGQSADAARLIATLAAEPAIRGPAFAAPVTRGTGDGQDQFVIAAVAAQ